MQRETKVGEVSDQSKEARGRAQDGTQLSALCTACVTGQTLTPLTQSERTENKSLLLFLLHRSMKQLYLYMMIAGSFNDSVWRST